MGSGKGDKARNLAGQLGAVVRWLATLYDRPRPQLIGLGIVCFLCGLGLRLVFQDVLGHRLAYVTFYPAVELASLLGGLASGLTAAALSALTVHLWFVPLHDAGDWMGLATFSVGTVVIAGIAEALHVTYKRLAGSEERARDAERLLAGKENLQERLRQNEKTFAELIERAPFGIYVVDSQFRIAMMNAGSQENAFRNVRSVIGHDFYEALHILWPEDVAAEIIGHFRHTLETGEPYYSPRFVNPRHDVGVVESYEWELHRIALPDGQHGVICYYFDSTELRQAEAELEAARQLTETAINRLPAAINVIRGRDLRLVLVNDGYRALAPGKAMLGRTLDEIWPETGQDFAAICRRVLETGEPHLVEDELNPIRRTPDGPVEARYFSWSLHRIRLPGDEGWGLLNSAWETTARKQAEEALQGQKRLLQSITDNADTALFIMDDRQQCVFMNPAAEKLTGYSLAETKGRALHDVVHHTRPDGSPYLLTECPIDQAFPKNDREQGEEIFVHKDGHFYPVAFTASPLRNEQGQANGTIIEVRDITERKQAEAALLEAARHKDEFLAMLAHELRNPLAPIRNMAAVLRRVSTGNPIVKTASEMIERQVAQMTRLVDDLLDISRIARGVLTVTKEACDLTNIVRCAVEDMRTQMEKRGLRLNLHAPHDPVALHGDKHRLAQAVQNLLHNAEKFTPEGGDVTVTLSVDAGRVEIAVKDSGPGIPPNLLPNIFEPFRQGPQALDRPKGGLGLGLALVEGIAQLHGGEAIAANNDDGPGAIFKIRLPLDRDAALPTEKLLAEAAGARRVLLVEDDHMVAESTRMLLNALGHEVKVAHDGAEALRLALAFRPDIVLCDIGLPAPMSGFDVARALREEPSLASIYLVAVSGYGHQEALEENRAAGFDLHLVKPVSEDRLHQLFSEAPVMAQA